MFQYQGQVIDQGRGIELVNDQGQKIPTGLQSIQVDVPLQSGARTFDLSPVLQQGFDYDQLVVGLSILPPAADAVTIDGKDLAANPVFNAAFLDYKTNNRSILDNLPLRKIVQIQDNNEFSYYPLPWTKAGNVNWQNSKIRIGGSVSIVANTALSFTFFALQ